jgi:hypothetical protein
MLIDKRTGAPLPRELFELVDPDFLTGITLATLWSEILERPIAYAGDELGGLEQRLNSFGPSWLTYGMKLMMGTAGGLGRRSGACYCLWRRILHPCLEGVFI